MYVLILLFFNDFDQLVEILRNLLFFHDLKLIANRFKLLIEVAILRILNLFQEVDEFKIDLIFFRNLAW